jgi:hypothetical protein
MTLKGWMLGNKNDPAARNARLRTPTATGLADVDPREPGFNTFGRRVAPGGEPVHLGPYAPLIGAIREELEQFVAHQLRLHLAIAERDRYVLASIEVECDGGEGERELLRRFVREFRPEQIKQYLAKEVIAGLRNAGAIDLSQFAGLNAEREEAGASRDEERYGDLIAELASGAPPGAARPYRVTLVGRWSELAVAAVESRASPREGTRTPLAARAVGIEIEDAKGGRRVELAAVPGHRYSVGKGEGCDVVVDGVYASRRHCELWFDRGAWWAADAGSTNGIRVESADGGTARDDGGAAAASKPAPLELRAGAWLVLAAHMRGEAKQYPRLSLHAIEPAAAPDPRGALSTPVTPIAAPRKRAVEWTLAVRMASGTREIELASGALPFRIGRSRNQALVIDWQHADVSGRHVEIVALDTTGARVVVHGDNGVTVEGAAFGPGAEFHWERGKTLRLGATDSATPCELTLKRAD